ncbi:hypothetical protein KFK09_020981 [Dendrobium nobile]|uniref:Uncharacterized protein n=1 Tax=Dendrobium nobile TaxID=94219 RepID=A0A8T3AMG8_DENNO|nr:hypothetical protein KFK09_020981 [Dendrobium nobile]
MDLKKKRNFTRKKTTKPAIRDGTAPEDATETTRPEASKLDFPCPMNNSSIQSNQKQKVNRIEDREMNRAADESRFMGQFERKKEADSVT